MPKSKNTVVALLLQMLDSAFHKRSWHGPNLRGSIRGLSAEHVTWRPQPNRHNIAEQIVHAAYWKYVVRRRLRGDKRGSFPLKGSNWIPITGRLTELVWQEYVRLLEDEHAALCAAVCAMPTSQIHRKPAGSTVSNFRLISGIICHDVYHAGQIQLLKRLQEHDHR